AWGIWRTPEAELGVLEDVSDKDVLELGCGAAQWSIALAALGAHTVGLDNSSAQLRHARQAVTAARAPVALVHASAEATPFRDHSFDIVFCDYGAMHFADPYSTVPEAARLLRPGGLLAFSTVSPICDMCWPNETDDVSTTLHRDYFGMHRFEWEEDATVSFNLNYSEWIKLFRSNGFTIDALIEPRPAVDATTTFEGRPLEWSRRWPSESIWKVRKEPAG
ncbi:MAG: class I SAM-dependent methyltransferase, partial [Actinomycetota bacterium]|nr:class I SAM-dependent methyltransferase [Actinomycetota bacterium]